MRSRPLWQRALVAVWSLWLVALLCEPVELHACPMHDHAAMRGMDMGASAAAAVQQGTGPVDHSMPTAACTCIGTCNSAASVAGPEPVFALLAAPVEQTRRAPAEFARIPHVARSYALPFATAPPAGATLI